MKRVATPAQRSPGGWSPGRTRRPNALVAVIAVGVALALLWAVQTGDWLAHGWLLRFGIVPRDPGRLEDVLAAPFLHLSWSHLEENTPPFAVLAFLTALGGLRRFLAVTLVVALTSGLGVWLIAPSHSITVGASGVIFGYLGYLLGRGAVERRVSDVLVAVLAGALYFSILPLLLPGNPAISWQAHLFGFLGGLASAVVLRNGARALPRSTPRSGLAAGTSRAGAPPASPAVDPSLFDLPR